MSYTDDLIAIGWVEAGNTTWPPPEGWQPPEEWALEHEARVRDLGVLELPRREAGEPDPLEQPPGHGWIEHRQPRRSTVLEPEWFTAATTAPAVRTDARGRPYWIRLGMGPHQAQLHGLVGGPLLWAHHPEKCSGWIKAARRQGGQALVQISWPQAAERAETFHGRVRDGLLNGQLGLSLGTIDLVREPRRGRVVECLRWVACECSVTPHPAICGTGRAGVLHG